MLEDTQIFCKVNVKGFQPPVKFTINFKKAAVVNELREEKNPDLKIYLSASCKEPNSHNHDKLIVNVNFFLKL